MSNQEQNLEQEILADARRRAERVTQRAKRDADRVVAEAKAFAQQEHGRLMQAVRQQAARQEQREQARAEQTAQTLRRQAFEDVLDRVRAEAERQLAELTDDERCRDALVRLAADAIRAMRGGSFVLVLRPQDRQRWGSRLAADVRAALSDGAGSLAQVTVSDEDLHAAGGLMVRSADGRELADQTFEARLDRLWEEIRARVAQMLEKAWKANT